MYDVAIIGAGVTGCASARELSRYKLNICVIEKEEDICAGTSKANSGIVHSGIDCKPGTLMAEMNLLGNELMEPLSRELDFEFKRNGSLILCFSEKDMPKLNILYEQGIKNKVPNLQILDQKQLHDLEPNISKKAIAAIYAPSSGIVCPFGMNIAFAENAAENGVEFQFDTEIKNIIRTEDGYGLEDQNGKVIKAKCVVNAAGVYADRFHNMVSNKKIHITPRRGEYCLLDKMDSMVSKTIFQLPTENGKGILVTPTVHGNILIGPTATDYENKNEVSTTAEGIKKVSECALKSVPNLPLRQVITSFAGNRAHEDGHEFIIEEVKDAPCFIDAAGIESPGLTSAPAIGIRVADIVEKILMPEKNLDFISVRKGILNPKKLSKEDYAALIRKNPVYGNIICRCEMITEGEIIDAVTRIIPAKSMDGVKRRTRAGMGRCQAGFCAPKTMEIIARERKIELTDITKKGGCSNMVVGKSRPDLEDKT